jgi:hypothetical protein
LVQENKPSTNTHLKNPNSTKKPTTILSYLNQQVSKAGMGCPKNS